MKNFLFVVFVSILCILSGCNADDERFLQRTDQFSQDVQHFRNAQMRILRNTTRSSDTLSKEALQILVDTLNINTCKFVEKHKDALKKDLSATLLDNDSVALLSVDEDAMQDFLEANFSEEFVVNFRKSLKGSMSESVNFKSLTELESLMLVNTEIYNELGKLSSNQYAVIDDGKPAKVDNCQNEYNQQIAKCNLASGFIYVLGAGTIAIAAIATEGMSLTVSTAIDTFFSVEACAVNVACKTKAKSNLEECRKKNNSKR